MESTADIGPWGYSDTADTIAAAERESLRGIRDGNLWFQPSLFGGVSRAAVGDTASKPWINPTPLSVLVSRELKHSLEIRRNPWHGFGFPTLAGIAGRQDRTHVFAKHWLSSNSPDYARQYHNGTWRELT